MKYIKSHKLFESKNKFDREYAQDIMLPLKEIALKTSIQFQGPGHTSPHPDTGENEKKIVCYINIGYFLQNHLPRNERKGSFTWGEIKGEGEVNHFIEYMLSCGYPLIRCRANAISHHFPLPGDWEVVWEVVWEEPEGSDMSGKDIPYDIFSDIPSGVLKDYLHRLYSFELTFKWN
jgi:hypothetical protein